MPSDRLQLGVMAKWPTPGDVKTRLCPPLSTDAAATLYTAFVADLLARLVAETDFDTHLLLSGRAGPVDRLGWPSNLTVEDQTGQDLGERLAHAAASLGAAGPIALLGSDHPNLPVAIIQAAAEALDDHEVVVGPSADGGYYLIGMQSPMASLFESMPWSTPRLLETTVARARTLGVTVADLPPWYDIDTGEDVARLKRHLTLQRLAHPGFCPRTWALLAAWENVPWNAG